jgi:tetratricopeptide (TPR) repeat protein
MLQIKQIGDKVDRGTVLKQSAGRSWTQSKNVPNSLTVETPSALAAIRGTDWELVVDTDGASTLTVLSGEVVLSNEMGSVNITAGEQAYAQKGVAPVKRILQNPRDRVQWVSSFSVDARRYPELDDPAQRGLWPELQQLGALLRAGDLAAARSIVDRLAAQTPASATALLLRADFQVLDGEIDAAMVALRAGASQFPQDERFEVGRARLHLVLDQAEAARTALTAARMRHSQSEEVMIAEGELERFLGHATAATAAYRSALAVAPQSARAWQGLGTVQSEREDVANARDSLQRALALDPNESGLRGELGTLETFADQLPAARAAFTQALETRADDYVALTGLALVDLKAGHTDEAMTRLLAATLIEPRYARAQTYLAVAYYQQGRLRDALFALARARELDAKDPLPDLLASIIHNDLLQPGGALATARRALSLMPYLKSLNQIANDMKGGANVGSALAAFGLEDWARSYAQDSYYPFWAGSHLFLADRYAGEFNKKSELFQGFLADPTVFGASNRFSTLVPRPGTYWTLGTHLNTSRDLQLSEGTLTANSYANSAFPVAYFAEVIRQNVRPDRLDFGADSNTYTLALGARPTHELGLFAYLNAFDADVATSAFKVFSSHIEGSAERIAGRTERIDLGAHYRFGPQSQAWLKVGSGNEASTAQQISTAGPRTKTSIIQTQPEQHDLQFRHTFAAHEQHELSWGGELGQMKKLTRMHETAFHLGSGPVPWDRLENGLDQDHSRDLWFSDRFHASERLTLQGDLAWQRYTKTRDLNVFYDRRPPKTEMIEENYERSFLAPRLGAAYALGGGATLRGAYQKWLRPASYNSLAPISTAGIPVDDSLVFPGGTLARTRGQLDWEVSPAWFITAFADRRKVDNLNSTRDGVLNTRADSTNLDRLRQTSLANLAAPDQLEATPVFARGRARSAGLTGNHVLSRNFAAYLGYTNTHSENTSIKYQGRQIPFLPEHRATVGITWAGDQRLTLSTQAVWRSTRFRDEANLAPMPAGWDMTLKLHWESADKRWSVEGYAANLLKRGTEDAFGVHWVARF